MLQDSPQAFGKSFEEELAHPMSFYEERFRGSWRNKEEGITAMFHDEQIVGTAGFFQNEGLKHRHEGTIWGVFVKPAYRGNGISKRLIADILRRVPNQPYITQVSLTLEASNKPARSVYESLGFKLWGTHPRSLKIGDRYYDEAYMTLLL